MSPKISVLMSVYNGEKFLKEAIDSVVNQTFRDFEFIIIDDASTDSSANIIKSYQDDRIFYFGNEKNLGLTKSLNKALAFAKGEFIARIDYDDICYQDRFEKQMKYIDEHKDCKILFSDITKIDDSGNAIPSYSRIRSSEDIYYLMHFINPVIHPTVLIKKELLIDAGGFNEEYQYAQDYELWSRLIYNFKFYKINKPLLYYRESSKQISKNKLSEQNRFAERVFVKNIKNLGFDDYQLDDILYFHQYAFQDEYKFITKNHLNIFREINKKIIEKAPSFLNKQILEKTALIHYYYYYSVYLRKFKIFNPLINIIKSFNK